MLRFPSVLWFDALKDQINSEPDRFRRLGTVDITLVVKVDYAASSQYFEIVFAGYRCASVRQIRDIDEAGPDAVIIEGPFQTWREMVESIQANGAADLGHTLNTLTLYDTPLRVTSKSQLDTDLFYRYQQNLQEFFDAAAKVTTYFAETEHAQAGH